MEEIKNPKFCRTSNEKKLSFDFSYPNRDTIKKYEDKIVDRRCYDKKYSLKDRISFFDNCIKAYYKLQEFCYQSEGGKIYFQDMWEYCHNSKNDCFAFVESLVESKQKLEKRLAKE